MIIFHAESMHRNIFHLLYNFLGFNAQVIVQRALAGENYTHSKAGTVLAGYHKFLPMFIIILPGMVARVLFPGKLNCGNWRTGKRFIGVDLARDKNSANGHYLNGADLDFTALTMKQLFFY